MKILHLITDLTLGGAETVLSRLVSRMDPAHFQSEVVSLGHGGSLVEQFLAGGTEVFTANRSFLRMHREVSRFKPDLIQGWMYHGNIAAFAESYLGNGKSPVLWNIRHSLGDLKGENKRIAALIRLGAWVSFRPVRIIYNSNLSARQHEEAGYKKSHSVIIPNGFDCELFQPSEENRLSVRKELGLPADALLVGFFARYHPVKDHQTFLTAAASVVQAGAPVHFVLAGRDVHSQTEELANRMQTSGISDRLHCIGERMDMPRLMSAVDVVACCSSSESFPNVIGEAMSCGVPSICTDVGDARILMANTGRIVPTRNAQALSAALLELLQMPRQDRIKMGELARARIISEFSLDWMVRRYTELYKAIVSPRP